MLALNDHFAPEFVSWIQEEVKNPATKLPKRPISVISIPFSQVNETQLLEFRKQKFGAQGGSDEFVAQIQAGSCPTYCYELPGVLPAPPTSLSTYISLLATRNHPDAHSYLFEDDIVVPPDEITGIISGSNDKAVRFRDSECGSFMGSIFHFIQHNSLCDVQLTGWDLYHGHMFVHARQVEDQVLLDLGILFHAKEFPMEYRKSQWSVVYPIGDPAMGGAKDPRTGTQCSIRQPDFPMRNYVWMFSTNKVYLIDPLDPSCPPAMLQNKEFSTVTFGFFGAWVADINYFPGLFTSNTFMGRCCYACEHIARAEKTAWPHLPASDVKTVVSSLEQKSINVQGRLDQKQAQKKQETSQKKQETSQKKQETSQKKQETSQKKQGPAQKGPSESEAEEKQIKHEAKPSVPYTPNNLERRVLLQQNVVARWYAEQVTKTIASSRAASRDILVYTHKGFTADLAVSAPARALATMYTLIGQLSDIRLEQLESVLKEGAFPQRAARIPPIARDFVKQLVAQRRTDIETQQREANQAVLSRLLAKGYDEKHCIEACGSTGSATGWNFFQADNLLQVAFPTYRPETFAEFQHIMPSLSHSNQVLKMTFDIRNALQAFEDARLEGKMDDIVTVLSKAQDIMKKQMEANTRHFEARMRLKRQESQRELKRRESEQLPGEPPAEKETV